MRTIKQIFFLVLTFLFFAPLASKGQESDLGGWLIFIGNKKIDSEWNWHHEVQYRNYNAIGDLEQLLLRTGIGRKVGERSNLLLGYGYIISENYINRDDKITINEHRIFQQFITKQKIGKLGLQHRYRFEQRFVESNDIRLRFRYFLALTYPIISFENRDDEIYLSAYDEIFLHTDNPVFDRNRLYGAVGYKISPNLKLELGYMNQYFERSGRDQVTLSTFFTW